MKTDLHRWEKWPIVALFVAQGLYVFAWYVGEQMPSRLAGLLPWLYVAGGAAAWVAIDGAMIATVAGMRAGRRSVWSVAAIVVTALFGAAVALNGHGALKDLGSWLHAGFALTITCYLMHLAAPPAEDRAAHLKAKAADLGAKLAQANAGLTAAAASVAQAEDRAAQAEALLAQAAEDVARYAHQTAQADAEAARLRRELARTPQPDDTAWLTYNGQRVTLAQLVEATGTPSATLRRKLAQSGTSTAQAAD